MNYKVGDKIVEFGRVFTIFKIRRRKNSDGDIEKVIYFKPFYKTKDVSDIVCSIPESNIDKTQIRQVSTKKEFRLLINKLKKKKNLEEFPAIDKAKALLNSSDPADTARVLRKLWIERNETIENFSRSKRDIYNLAMERLVQEFATVSGFSLEKARKRIDLALQS